MAAEPRASDACWDLVLFLAALQAVPSFAEDPCTGPKDLLPIFSLKILDKGIVLYTGKYDVPIKELAGQACGMSGESKMPEQTEIRAPCNRSQPPSTTQFITLILLTVFLLLMCGIGASCVKFCCRKKRPPVQTFPPTAHDLTIIPMDHDSTAHSTVTSYSSVQYPPSFPIPFPFREVDRSTASPPAYSLYAIELPPSYDEAIRMTKPYLETPFASQKLEAPTAELAAPPPNQELQTLPETSSGNSAVEQEGSRSPEVSTEGQPEPH